MTERVNHFDVTAPVGPKSAELFAVPMASFARGRARARRRDEPAFCVSEERPN